MTIQKRDRPIRVFWWQGGLHIEPQTDEQRAALVGLWGLLSEDVRIDHGVHPGPVGAVQADDQEPVIAVHETP